MKLLCYTLLCLFLCGGCFIEAKPLVQQPPVKTATVERVDVILKDTADDLELGAKVRTLVYKQDQKRSRKPSKDYYEPLSILVGAGVLLAFVLLHHCWVSGGKDAR